MNRLEKGVPMRTVSRSIAVLREINRHGSLSMTAIAKHGSLAYPTACRIVQTLMVEGLVEQEPQRKRYRPTELVRSLAHGYSPEHRLADAARPHIHDLTREIGWPVFITVRAGTQMIVQTSTHSETSLSFGPCHAGFTVPLLTSATGLIWLAHVAKEEAEHLIHWANLLEEVANDIDYELWADKLSAIREIGYTARACANGSPNRSASIAVPIMLDDRIQGVLTLCYFATAMKQEVATERYFDRLRNAAASITADL